MVTTLSEGTARQIAAAYSGQAFGWFGGNEQSFEWAVGVTLQASYTATQIWLDTWSMGRQYVSVEKALAMTTNEPPAPPEYTAGTTVWSGGLGDRVDCPTCSFGKTTCKACNGTEHVSCPRCSKTPHGAAPCGTCTGTGWVNAAVCPKCQGTRVENPCSQCKGSRRIPCPNCSGGQQTCEMCEGVGKVFYVDVNTKEYEVRQSRDHGLTLPVGVWEMLYRSLPCIKETPLDYGEEPPARVLLARRLDYSGNVTFIHCKRFKTMTLLKVGNSLEKVPRWLAKVLPLELRPPR